MKNNIRKYGTLYKVKKKDLSIILWLQTVKNLPEQTKMLQLIKQ